MAKLEVPGAIIHYETCGNGPLLLMIHGANGSGDVYKGVIDTLSKHLKVVTYDRRGFTRSKLIGSQDPNNKLEADVNDARLLIQHLSSEPAIVFGSSSGAIVALKLYIDHPSIVRTLFPHEPPAMKVLDEGESWLDFFSEIYDSFHELGMELAIEKFRKNVLAESDLKAISNNLNRETTISNLRHWMEYELWQYTSATIDLDALKTRSDNIFPLAGQESRGYPAHEVSRVLSMKLNRHLTELPGGHNGYITRPAEFAREFTVFLLQ